MGVDILVYEWKGKWELQTRLLATAGKLKDPIVLLLKDKHFMTLKEPKLPPRMATMVLAANWKGRGGGRAAATEADSNSDWLAPARTIGAGSKRPRGEGKTVVGSDNGDNGDNGDDKSWLDGAKTLGATTTREGAACRPTKTRTYQPTMRTRGGRTAATVEPGAGQRGR